MSGPDASVVINLRLDEADFWADARGLYGLCRAARRFGESVLSRTETTAFGSDQPFMAFRTARVLVY
jgi:hypothetical protein